MPMHPLAGHHQARRRLADSNRSGRLPQVLLITGAGGIGKQRLALWLGQLLFCARPAEEPCGTCRACKLVLELAHPDLHWFVPIARPKASDTDKQVEEAAELLADAMAERREQPLYAPADGMSAHPLASARLLLRRAALTPVEGARKFFVIGEAERLVPQESSPDAANALLKLLEEPPADTRIVLTTTEPERVLPTIRSRAVPLRLARLADAEVRQFAQSHWKGAPADLDREVRMAEGAIGALIGRGEAASKAAAEARALLGAIGGGRAARLERSLKQAPWSARGGFTDLLDALAAELSERARHAADRDSLARLTAALERLRLAREEAQGNCNPQLLLASLAGELAEVL